MSNKYVDFVITKTDSVNILHIAPGFSNIKPGNSFIGESLFGYDADRFTADLVLTISKERDEYSFILELSGYDSLDNIPKVFSYTKVTEVEIEWPEPEKKESEEE